MKIVSKLLCSIWAITLLVMLNVAFPAGASGMSVPPIVYSEQMQMSIAYDAASSSTFDYDSASTLSTNESENRIREEGGVFAQFAEFLAAENTASKLGSLTPAQARQIQAFADRFGAEVNVVGSRAAGTAGPLSDFDYVIGGNSSLRNSAGYYLPRGAAGGELRGGIESGIDIFNANKTPLDPTRPFIQFTPGQPPVVGPH